ncbi:tyrosine-type recombinase/integrase [Candidatus Woesearchaeota archaeon]|nr:tyrosine-type recombinase/integrase [Candidatus Woesearchaeota archaeon]
MSQIKSRDTKPELTLRKFLNARSVYLFHGNNHSHLSSRAVQEIIKSACCRAGSTKNVHPHTLRHSFATHLLETGVDVIAVQTLFGNAEVRTTMVYLHAAKPKLLSIRSPLDAL